MKKLISFTVILCLVAFVNVSKAQQTLPSGVKFNFETMYPQQPIEKSYTDTLKSVYILFKQNGQTMLARYSKEGYWQFSGSKLAMDKSPQDLRNILTENYMKKKLVPAIYKISTPYQDELYFVEFVDGNKKEHYIFNASGVLLGY